MQGDKSHAVVEAKVSVETVIGKQDEIAGYEERCKDEKSVGTAGRALRLHWKGTC
jgi:hypothetical protein